MERLTQERDAHNSNNNRLARRVAELEKEIKEINERETVETSKLDKAQRKEANAKKLGIHHGGHKSSGTNQWDNRKLSWRNTTVQSTIARNNNQRHGAIFVYDHQQPEDHPKAEPKERATAIERSSPEGFSEGVPKGMARWGFQGKELKDGRQRRNEGKRNEGKIGNNQRGPRFVGDWEPIAVG